MANRPLPAPVLVKTEGSVSSRVQRLQQQARSLATEDVQAFILELRGLEQRAAEIAEGGEAYPAGIRDICQRLAEDAEGKAKTIAALAGRQ